jgi:hypothetical protein
MKKLLEIKLGIVTSIGGCLDAGSIATAAQAGARFGYQLLGDSRQTGAAQHQPSH